jgi:hypothetical protein
VSRANGNGYVQCANGQSDCDSSVCDNPATVAVETCGNCSVTDTKPCFVDPIVADGTADPENPVLVTTFCIPPTISAAINSTGGLPGPARAAVDMTVENVY